MMESGIYSHGPKTLNRIYAKKLTNRFECFQKIDDRDAEDFEDVNSKKINFHQFKYLFASNLDSFNVYRIVNYICGRESKTT